jgi:hydroxypyruvate isomerase
MLFTEVPFLDRFGHARRAGFEFVEYQFPYPYAPAELKQRLDDHGLRQVLFNLPAGDWAAGDRGIGAAPGREAEFRRGVATAIAYARALGVPRLNCLAGTHVSGRSEQEHWQTLVQNARFAAQALAPHGLELLIEPINRSDIPGFVLNRSGDALRLLDEVGLPNVRLQYDAYHAQREEGELAATITRNLARIGHIQIADNPGRHQPGTGEINFPFLFRRLDELNYPGFVGLEYAPVPDTVSSLGWLRDYGFEFPGDVTSTSATR